MLELLALIWLLAGFGWFWSSSLAAGEAARVHGRDACREAGVQWLDQSVQLVAMRLRRRPDGWLAIEREYRFDYSRDGESRQSGRLVLLGTRITALSGPDRQPVEP